MKYGFVGNLYHVMRAGDTSSFRRMLRNNPMSALNRGADGCIAPVLISAVFADRIDYLEALLDAGADPNLRDTSTKGSAHDMCALHAALWLEHDAMANLLRQHGATEDFGTAVFERDTRSVRTALRADGCLAGSAYIRSTFTMLHVAAELSSAPLAKLFLKAGLDPRQEDGHGHAPLRYAARNTPAIGVMAALVDAGADVNAASRTGITALTAACRSNESLKAVAWLLEHGADPNLVPRDRNGPLLRATRLKNTKMVETLLAHGADPAFTGKKGETARSIAETKDATAILDLLSSSEARKTR